MKTSNPNQSAHWSPSSFAAAIIISTLVISLAGIANAQNIGANQSGNWNTGAIWTPAGPPIATAQVAIGGGFQVSYTTGSTPNLSLLYVGDPFNSLSANGTLNITGGTISLNSNNASAIRVGNSTNSVGVLNINGGSLIGNGNTSGPGLQVGFGANSTGTVNVTSGNLTIDNALVVGVGNGSTGSFNVSGGTVTLGISGFNPSPSINIGNRAVGSTTASYSQTAGTVLINNGTDSTSSYFGIGYAGNNAHTMNSTASITGGNFTGNVRVGRQSNVTSGGGTGTLTIGSAANVSGREQAWELSGSGEIIFTLGANATFSAVNLTAATGSTAFDITQTGADITINGTSLAFSPNYGPISLITYASGKAPSLASQSNVAFNFIGFDSQFATPTLTWTNTALVLNVVPEPSSVALIFIGAAAVGLAASRRRRNVLSS